MGKINKLFAFFPLVAVLATAGVAAAAPDLLEIKLTASDAAAGDFFGCSVSIDGPTAIIGASGSGKTSTDSRAHLMRS